MVIHWGYKTHFPGRASDPQLSMRTSNKPQKNSYPQFQGKLFDFLISGNFQILV